MASSPAELFTLYLQAWSTGNPGLLDQIVSPDYVGHVAAGDRNLDGIKDRIKAFRATMVNIAFEVEEQFTQGDRTVTRLTATGTDVATGEPVRMNGINIARIASGLIAEEWSVWERCGRKPGG